MFQQLQAKLEHSVLFNKQFHSFKTSSDENEF
jgi:hypothetical protein